MRFPHVSASSARASALAEAKGEFVLCSDDDCRPDPGILDAYMRAVAKHEGVAIGGDVRNILAGDLYATATQEIISFVVSAWNRDPIDAKFFTVSSLLFPTKALREIGGFDASWLWRTGEDRDICRRWCESGRRMVYCAEALMWHAHGLTLRKFARQHFHYGEGNWASWQRRSVVDAGAPDFSGVRFYGELMMSPFRSLPLAVALRVAAAMVFAQFANIAGFVSAWLRSPRDMRPSLDEGRMGDSVT
jgi:cellulose synthase/poly-beta-1,6-N-acetylglucosamine synthase-like glycosyltransferase